MTSHRSRTRRASRTWQLTALVLSGGAAALAFSPLSKYLSSRTFVPPAPEGGAEVPYRRVLLPRTELANLAEEMKRIAGRVEVAPQPAVDVAMNTDPLAVEEPEVGPEPEPAPISEWVYKSYLGGPNLKAATVNVGDHQMLVCQGRIYDQIKVIEVLPTHMTIEEGGVRKRLDIAARVVTGFPTDGGVRPAAMARPGTPGFQQPGLPGNAGTVARGMAANPGVANSAMEIQRAALMQAVATPPPRPVYDETNMAHTLEDVKMRIETMSDEQREFMFKMLNDKSVDPGKRMSILQELNLSPKLSVEERMTVIEMFGVNAADDPQMMEAIKGGGK